VTRPPSLHERPIGGALAPCALAPRALALCALALCALALTTPLAARAADVAGHRVLLVGQERDAFLERVGAEIEAIGFSVVRSDASGPLEVSARAAGAVAAIRLLPSRKGVEVWMADATSGRSLLRQVVVDESPGGPDRDLIALQTAELLRTSLRGEKPARDSSTPRAAAATAPRAAANAPIAAGGADDAGNADSAAQLAFGTLYSPGGASPSAELGLSLQHFFARSVGLGLDFALPVAAGSIDELEGSAAISAYLAGAVLLLRLAPDAKPWFASAGAGAALLIVRYDGDAAEPLQASSGSRATEAAYARADLGLALTGWLRLGVRALAGVSVERVRVTFAGNAAGNYGPVLLAGFAFAGVYWP
jgi:hypothetical protein